MDRFAAMLVLLGTLVTLVLFILAVFTFAPILSSCVGSLFYTLYLFIKHEQSGFHSAQEFENRFWTLFALLLSTAVVFAQDSPLAVGRWSPSLGFAVVMMCGYLMHLWDRYLHRIQISRQIGLRRGGSAAASLNRLKALGIPVEEQLAKVNSNLADIDQLLIPSTINNFINQRFIMKKEREIIQIFEEAEPKALNYLISHVKLGLLFYKIKDHRSFSGQHRTELIELLAVARLPVLSVISRVIVLHSLQMMKLPANANAEYWVQNIILSTKLDELSELKTLSDAKGDYFSMHKLLFEDIRSETVRQSILSHFRKEAAIQQAHMAMRTRKSRLRLEKAWRKILSDVDDTLTSSGGIYPAGIDKRFTRKVVYPGVLAFYRELDLGTRGPEEWPPNQVGNLVFLSARPHLYKDVSEKQNFAKFEKLRSRGGDARGNMHTIPSLLPGDIASGREYIVSNDMKPLAMKKFENFKGYVSIYPEFTHVFVCDNGQGDVKAGELMFDAFPQQLEAVYVHVVQSVPETYGYRPEEWRKKGFKPVFFQTYPDAALHAARRQPPLIRVSGLQRICEDAVRDFYMIQTIKWSSQEQKRDRRDELNQALWRCNHFLSSCGLDRVPLLEAEQKWRIGEKVRTPYGIARIRSFDPIFDMYGVELDWRPLNVQVAEHQANAKHSPQKSPNNRVGKAGSDKTTSLLETVHETAEEGEEEHIELSFPGVDQEQRDASSTHDVAHAEEKLAQDFTGDATIRDNATGATKDAEDREDTLVQGDSSAETPLVSSASSLSDSESSQGPADSSDMITEGERSGDVCSMSSHSDSTFQILARIQGRYISKYTPPTLPVLPKEKSKGSRFTFWGTSTEGTKGRRRTFKAGDKVETPYGTATVVERRSETRIVVVDMVGWSARAFLHEDCIKLPKSLFGNLLKRLGSSDLSETSAPAQAKSSRTKDVEFSEGSTAKTPFGMGVIIRPLPDTVKRETLTPRASTRRPAPGKTSSGDRDSDSASDHTSTLGISLTSWTLADNSHPVLYCTPESAREWKNIKVNVYGKSKATGIFSAMGTFVTETMRIISSQPEKKQVVPAEIITNRFEQYYQLGASVSTMFGHGIVRGFREADGFYEVSLQDWKLAGGQNASAFLRFECLDYFVAQGAKEGYPVLTSLGVSGVLASVEPTTGVHIVTVPSAGMVCYLQPKEVIKPLKAAVGEAVMSPYGEGKVRRYRLKDDMYEIEMRGWGGAMLYAKGESFDRISDEMRDQESSTGMNWLIRRLWFFSSEDKKADGSRSRSNSIVSLRSQSGKS